MKLKRKRLQMKQNPNDHGAGWIGVDLDGTLAKHPTGRFTPTNIGEPIPRMVSKVRELLKAGIEVRIFTARMDSGKPAIALGNPDGALFSNVEEVRKAIEKWCKKHLGKVLPVTNVKDYGMIELWDDRCRRVERDTGRFI